MRRLVAALALLGLVMFPAGCRRKKSTKTREDGLASVVNMGDPGDAAQIVRGFSNIEADAWRWSTSKFAVVLRPPSGAAQNGAKLQMAFTLHDAVNKLGPMTVKATVNGTAIDPETFSQSGDCVYAHDVPAQALVADAVTVEFSTDKAIAPSDQDKRELSLIVRSIGLVAK